MLAKIPSSVLIRLISRMNEILNKMFEKNSQVFMSYTNNIESLKLLLMISCKIYLTIYTYVGNYIIDNVTFL